MSKEIFENIKETLIPSDALIQRTKTEADRIQNPSPKPQKSRGWITAAACLAVAAAITIPSAFLLPFHESDSIFQENASTPESGKTSMDKEKAKTISVTAYASTNPEQTLTANYRNETTATKLLPHTKVLLAQYSPLLSSVPGYPMQFEVPSESDAEYRIAVFVDNGNLVKWDSGTGDIQNQGSQYELKNTETLFWSPVTSTGMAKDATITVVLLQDEEELARQEICILEENLSYYMVAGEPKDL